jgi:hypothetical protein
VKVEIGEPQTMTDKPEHDPGDLAGITHSADAIFRDTTDRFLTEAMLGRVIGQKDTTRRRRAAIAA